MISSSFSDKSCAFPNKSPDLAWRRWLKKAVFEAAVQAYGAERWILKFPDRIYLDKKCTQRFPLPLPPLDRVRVHRVVIALNAAERCKAFFGRGSGSLKLRSDVIGESHFDHPFTIGQLDPTRGYVHVLDSFALDVVMREVDTASDFVDYLSKKERVTTAGKLVEADGEEELVAYYSTHWDADGSHDFVPEDNGAPLEIASIWNDLERNAKYLAKNRADIPSYHWDDLIEPLNYSYVSRKIDPRVIVPFDEFELLVRLMASESRLARRWYGGTYYSIRQKDTCTGPTLRIFRSHSNPRVAYIFLIFPLNNAVVVRSRQWRLSMLSTCCVLAFMRYGLDHAVGIAVDPLTVAAEERSIDAAHINHTKMNDEMRTAALHMKQVMQIPDFPEFSDNFVREYPEIVPLAPNLYFQSLDTYYVGREQTYVKQHFLAEYLEKLIFKIASAYTEIVYVDGYSWRDQGERFEDTSLGLPLWPFRHRLGYRSTGGDCNSFVLAHGMDRQSVANSVGMSNATSDVPPPHPTASSPASCWPLSCAPCPLLSGIVQNQTSDSPVNLPLSGPGSTRDKLAGGLSPQAVRARRHCIAIGARWRAAVGEKGRRSLIPQLAPPALPSPFGARTWPSSISRRRL